MEFKVTSLDAIFYQKTVKTFAQEVVTLGWVALGTVLTYIFSENIRVAEVFLGGVYLTGRVTDLYIRGYKGTGVALFAIRIFKVVVPAVERVIILGI